jgi:hypothetical protein
VYKHQVVRLIKFSTNVNAKLNDFLAVGVVTFNLSAISVLKKSIALANKLGF